MIFTLPAPLVLCRPSCVCLGVQVAESAPLVGEREDLSSLEKEYTVDDAIYQAKIQVGSLSHITPSTHSVTAPERDQLAH